MEVRPSRGRGGQWRRGGGGGRNDPACSGDWRGRGRGGHHRGRGKREHHRGRGRGLPEDGARGIYREVHDEQDDKENTEDEIPASYSRRKLESNWDRYEESEKEVVNDVPLQRGTDYHVLLTSAGDSFTQFRFSEEKDWEVDSLGNNQVPALFVDLEALARSLQELPLHQRLNVEPGLVQESTPVELPSVGVLNKVDPAVGAFKLPTPALFGQQPDSHGLRPMKPVPDMSMCSNTSTAMINPTECGDEALDLLLGLQKPVTGISSSGPETSDTVQEVSPIDKKEEMEEQAVDVDQAKPEEETTDRIQQELQQNSKPVKQEMTEEDLEDWLDSMIS